MPEKCARVAATEIAAAKPYEPTVAERKALSRLIDGIEQTANPSAKVEVRGACTHLSWDHPHQAIAAALWADSIGTNDLVFAGAVFEQIAQVARTGSSLSENEFNGMLALVRGLAPTDPTEALLATQMAAVHNATMVAARRLAHANTPAQQDSASTTFNKLARTFAAQVEALKRYRHPNIKAQNVTVNEGGQAIVGNVQHAPGGSLKSEKQSHVLSASDALGPALLGHLKTHGQPMPSPGREGKKRMPIPRRPSRSPKGPCQRRLSARQPHQ